MFGSGGSGGTVFGAGGTGGMKSQTTGGMGGSKAGGAGSSGSGGAPVMGGKAGKCDMGAVDGGAPAVTPPGLTPGVWKNITPAALDMTGTWGTTGITVDPNKSSTLYLDTDQRGLWKSADWGATWARLGTPPSAPNYGTTANYLDSPVEVRVDPADSQHLYAVQGVRGQTQGLWVSHDGGTTWAQPAGFIAVVKEIATADMTTLTVDPSDFKHMLVGSHSSWKGLPNGGILETKDGGETFIKRQPVSSWPSGSMGIQFLYDPCQGIGDSNTWLVSTDGPGAFWRTTDAGATWTHLDGSLNGLHGQASLYYAKTGVVYSGASQYPIRSKDNGVTWEKLSTLPYASYMGIMGDGNNIYTLKSCACGGGALPSPGSGDQPYAVSPESDGATWTAYKGGAQKFGNGPLAMDFDRVGRVMYSANWQWGLWALRVVDP